MSLPGAISEAAESVLAAATIAPKCPGLYCGRMRAALNATTPPATLPGWSECGACPTGYRVAHDDDEDLLMLSAKRGSECLPCLDDPSAYDWMYLGFMAVVPLILHWFSVDLAARRTHFTRAQLALHACCLAEVCGAAVLTLVAFAPFGRLHFQSCSVRRIADWYTLFHNPTPNYETKLYCTQEAVYPLQTMVLVFYLLCIVLMMLVRPWMNRLWMKEAKTAVYSALYFLPILALLHTVAGGLIYYAFPYLSIILSMISNAAHFSLKTNQDMLSLVMSSVREFKNTTIILGHWLLLAYGIVALHQHLAFLAFVPFPAIFYIITVKFTNPGEIHARDEHSC